MFSFDNCIVVGLMRYQEDGKTPHEVILNPDIDTIAHPSDKIIVIAEDNDTYKSRAVPHAIDHDYVHEIAAHVAYNQEVNQPYH